ncbi:MAG: hypothetical protein KGJ86_02075 [Chloroflexota bacterium]|nr:hypothetical protein [Chloroflexota bacterium]
MAAEMIEVEDSLEQINDYFYKQGWTDGLPVVPPTEPRVNAMLAYTDRDPDDLMGLIGPRWGKATVRKLAVNAVMAGCLPRFFPIVIAAVEAMLEPDFNLAGIQATTNPAAPLLILNGPIRHELEVNAGGNVFGQGWRSNATLGRAIRLILLNIGGGEPVTVDKATFGQPGKYTYCIAENEERSPWPSFSVERGFTSQASTVTVVGAAAPHNIIVMGSQSGEDVLSTLADAMTAAGNNLLFFATVTPVVAICPEYAALVARDGFSKDEAKRYLYEHARVPLDRFTPGQRQIVSSWKEHCLVDGGSVLKVVERPEDILLLVAGGAGKHAVFLPVFDGRASTKPVARRDGRLISSVEDFRSG